MCGARGRGPGAGRRAGAGRPAVRRPGQYDGRRAGGSGGRAGGLRAVSLVYGRGELAGERAYVAVATDHLGVRAEVLEADEVLDYDLDAATAVDHPEPRAGLRGLATQVLMTAAAARTGADLILTGVGSDELFAVPDFELAD